MSVYHKKHRHTLQQVCKDASKYKTVLAWKCRSTNSYRAAYHNGWIEKATAHMELGSLKEELESLRFVIYKVELSDGYFYFGVTRNPKLRAWHHRNHWQSPVFQHLRRHSAEYKFMVLRAGLNGLEAYNLEKWLISKHAGVKMLNKNAGGTVSRNISLVDLQKLTVIRFSLT